MSVRFDFAGRSAIVTGAAQGIGLQIATLLAQSGAQVFMVDVDEERIKQEATEIGAVGVGGDVSKTPDVEAVTERVRAETGRIDVLVNNAGILRDRVLWKLSDDDWQDVLSVHAGGTFRFIRSCVPVMREQRYGRIVNVTSYSGLRGNMGQANYATAKAGIIGLTKTAAKELAAFGITVNAISPHADTRMLASVPQEKRDQLIAATPMQRLASPSEIAPAVAFLASEDAGFITGAILPVDGGISI
jgi:3-oxoacyl-[acyl-carrier protein] reductase